MRPPVGVESTLLQDPLLHLFEGIVRLATVCVIVGKPTSLKDVRCVEHILKSLYLTTTVVLLHVPVLLDVILYMLLIAKKIRVIRRIWFRWVVCAVWCGWRNASGGARSRPSARWWTTSGSDERVDTRGYTT